MKWLYLGLFAINTFNAFVLNSAAGALAAAMIFPLMMTEFYKKEDTNAKV